LNWRRDSPEQKGTTAIMFENTVLNQTIRLEEKKNETFLVEIREGAELMTSDVFEEFKKAKDYVINYMKNASEKAESITNNSKSMFEKLFTKTLIEKPNKRTIDKENSLFEEQTQEYLRNLNTIINNENLSEELIKKSKEIRDFIKKKIK